MSAMTTTPARHRMSRRGFLSGSLAGAGLLALTGCGSSVAGSGSSSGSMRTFASDKGAVRIPAQPHRVVCTDFVTTAIAYDAGVMPVGIDGKSLDYVIEAAVRKFADVPRVRSAQADLDLEAIAALQPDIILATTLTEDFYDKLTGIAPTVFITYANGGGNWPDIEARFADALGHADAITALKARYARTTATIRTGHATTLAKYRWDLIDGDPGTWYLHGPLSSHGKVLTDAGVRLGATAEALTKAFSPMSYERIGVLTEAGALGVGVTNSGEPTAGTAELLRQKSFAALPAERAGRVFHLEPFYPVSYGAALALLGSLGTALTALSA